jgi:predicted SprT family Zn-dependent metalloprotease
MENLEEITSLKIKEYKKQISHLNIEIYPIKVKFNLKSRTALGTVRFENKDKNSFLIKLNKNLYDKYKNEYLEHVLKHEFAHTCVMSAYKTRCKPHGKEWKNFMYILGEHKPRASTNKFDLEKSGYIWKCKCNKFIFGKIKHKNAIKNKARRSFYCRKCKRKLFFSGEYSGN